MLDKILRHPFFFVSFKKENFGDPQSWPAVGKKQKTLNPLFLKRLFEIFPSEGNNFSAVYGTKEDTF